MPVRMILVSWLGAYVQAVYAYQARNYIYRTFQGIR